MPRTDAFGLWHISPTDVLDAAAVLHIARCDRCRRDFPEFAAAVDELDRATGDG